MGKCDIEKIKIPELISIRERDQDGAVVRKPKKQEVNKEVDNDTNGVKRLRLCSHDIFFSFITNVPTRYAKCTSLETLSIFGQPVHFLLMELYRNWLQFT